MAIKLNGSTSGSVALDAPADTSPSGTDVTLTLPTSAGSSGQYLQTNGSGVLSWVTPAAALFESYAVIADLKASGTDGGTFTSGAWRTRDLNTEISDADNIVSISSNQFTLGAGTYLICWTANAFTVNRHQSRLYDVTNTSSLRAGTTEYASTGDVGNRSFGWHRVTITGSTTYRIEHRCQTTKSTNGFGLQCGFGESETYTIVQIYKEA